MSLSLGSLTATTPPATGFRVSWRCEVLLRLAHPRCRYCHHSCCLSDLYNYALLFVLVVVLTLFSLLPLVVIIAVVVVVVAVAGVAAFSSRSSSNCSSTTTASRVVAGLADKHRKRKRKKNTSRSPGVGAFFRTIASRTR